MSTAAQAFDEDPHQPVLVISDSLDDNPLGLLPCPVPLRQLPSLLFTSKEFQRAPLVLLDDHSFSGFELRHVSRRPGLIVVAADPDDGSVYPRAVQIGAEAVIELGHGLNWLHMRLHEATGCRYADWDALLTGGPPDPPPTSGS